MSVILVTVAVLHLYQLGLFRTLTGWTNKE